MAAARETDLTQFSAVISVEDTTTDTPLRIEDEGIAQLVLRFDDIIDPIDDYVPPDEDHIRSALEFGRRFVETGMMIHCHAMVHIFAIRLWAN